MKKTGAKGRVRASLRMIAVYHIGVSQCQENGINPSWGKKELSKYA